MENLQLEVTPNTKAGVKLTNTQSKGKQYFKTAALSTAAASSSRRASPQRGKDHSLCQQPFLPVSPPLAALPDAIQVVPPTTEHRFSS